MKKEKIVAFFTFLLLMNFLCGVAFGENILTLRLSILLLAQLVAFGFLIFYLDQQGRRGALCCFLATIAAIISLPDSFLVSFLKECESVLNLHQTKVSSFFFAFLKKLFWETDFSFAAPIAFFFLFISGFFWLNYKPFRKVKVASIFIIVFSLFLLLNELSQFYLSEFQKISSSLDPFVQDIFTSVVLFMEFLILALFVYLLNQGTPGHFRKFVMVVGYALSFYILSGKDTFILICSIVGFVIFLFSLMRINTLSIRKSISLCIPIVFVFAASFFINAPSEGSTSFAYLFYVVSLGLMNLFLPFTLLAALPSAHKRNYVFYCISFGTIGSAIFLFAFLFHFLTLEQTYFFALISTIPLTFFCFGLVYGSETAFFRIERRGFFVVNILSKGYAPLIILGLSGLLCSACYGALDLLSKNQQKQVPQAQFEDVAVQERLEYRGLLDAEYPITMKLVFSGAEIKGYYFFENTKDSISLRGRQTPKGKIYLFEYFHGKRFGFFYGQQEDELFFGRRENLVQKNSSFFELERER